MTNEEMERAMQFIVEQQAQFSVDIQRLNEADSELRRTLSEHQTQSNERMSRLEAIVERVALQQAHMNDAVIAVVETQDRTNHDVRVLTTQVDRIAEAVAVLLDRAGNGKEEGR